MRMSYYLQKQYSNQKWYIYTILFIWLRSYFSTLWRWLGIEGDIMNCIILLFLFIQSQNVWKGRILIKDFVLYFVIVFCYTFSVLLYPATSGYVHANAFSVICCIVPYIFVGEIFQTTNYEKWINYASRFAVFMNVVLILTSRSSGDEIDNEYMHRAYSLLPSVLFVLWQYIKNRRIIDLVFFCIGLVLILSMGSRGPVVCILFFVGSYLLFFKQYKRPIVFKSIIIGILSLLFFYTQYIAELMVAFFSKYSLSTRVFDMMLDDAFLNYEDSNGRNIIHEILFQKLNNDTGGIGFGLFSDRSTIAMFSEEITYSHNMFVELWFSFGYYVGTFIALLLLVFVAFFFYKIKNRDKQIFALLLFSVSVIKLQFSSSFIVDQSLFFLIGYCIYGIRESKCKTSGIIKISNK